MFMIKFLILPFVIYLLPLITLINSAKKYRNLNNKIEQCNINCLRYVSVLQKFGIKSDHHYTRGITPKRVTSAGAHLRCLAPGQNSSEETSQRWRAVGDTVSDLNGPVIKPQTSRTYSDIFNDDLNRPVQFPNDHKIAGCSVSL